MAPKSIDEIVAESKFKGYEQSIKEQLGLWSRGEITQAEFMSRRAVIKSKYFTWRREAEARGWKATPQEKRQATQALQAAKREQAEQEIRELLPAFSRGELSRQELKEQKDVIERQYLRGYQRRYTAPPQDVELIESYTVRRILREDPAPQITTTRMLTLEQAVSGGYLPLVKAEQIREAAYTKAHTQWIESPARQREADLRFQEQYADILERAQGQPVYYDPEADRYYWFEKTETTKELLEVPEWSRFRGAKPDSPAYNIQQGSIKIFQEMEKGFTGLTAPIEKQIAERETASLQLAAEGKPWAGFGAYAASVGAYTLYSAFEAFTFPVRPIRVGETISGVVALATTAEARRQLIGTIAKDPFKVAAGVAGGLAGGYAFGRVASKAADVTLGKPQPIKEYVTAERITARPRKVTTTKRVKGKQIVLTKDPTKVLRTKLTGWDKIPVDEDLGTGFLARHKVDVGGAWPKSGVKGFGAESMGGRAALFQEVKPTRIIYKPRIEVIYGTKRAMRIVPQIQKTTRIVSGFVKVPEFKTILRPVQDLTPAIFTGLGGATRVIPIQAPIQIDYAISPTRTELEQAVKLKQINVAHPKYETVTRIEKTPIQGPRFTLKVEPMITTKTILRSEAALALKQDTILKQKQRQILKPLEFRQRTIEKERKTTVPIIRYFEGTQIRRRQLRLRPPRVSKKGETDYLKGLFAGEFRGYKLKGPKEILELV
jgi:hypothetical protein